MITDREIALDLIKNLAPIRGIPVFQDDDFLELELEKSAATLGSQKAYRWQFVSARFLQIHPQVQTLNSAEGAQFTKLEIPIATLLGLQLAEDTLLVSLGWKIPSGYQISSNEANQGAIASSRKPISSTIVRSKPYA